MARTRMPRPYYRGGMEVPAVRSPRIGRAAVCITVLVLAADQISKALALAAAGGSRGGLVSVRLVRNSKSGAPDTRIVRHVRGGRPPAPTRGST